MYNHKEFFEWERFYGNTQDNPKYVSLHRRFADKIMEELEPESLLDIGCGTGAMIEYLIPKINAHGADHNRHHFKYFKERNPAMADRFHVLKAKNIERVMIDYDVITAIECFEHFDNETIDIVTGALRCRWLVFSSTPYSAKMDGDIGHINIRLEIEWINHFESYGFELIDRWNIPTKWTLIFAR